jgi:hypothetical protein
LTRARTILAAGVGEDAGRNAYLAGFHAAQALIAERTGKDAKTHRGVPAQFARLTRNEPRLGRELRQFPAQAYDLKSIADYGLGPDTEVPLDRRRGDRHRRTIRRPGRGAVDVAARRISGTLCLFVRLVVAAVHTGHDDIALDQRIVEPRAAEASAGRTDPAQLLRPGEEFGRHGPVCGIGGLDVGEGVLGIGVCLGDSTRDDPADFLRPRRIGIRRQQQDREANRAAPSWLTYPQVREFSEYQATIPAERLDRPAKPDLLLRGPPGSSKLSL